jgi:tetratricopeptide (TPR) repeat protein
MFLFVGSSSNRRILRSLLRSFLAGILLLAPWTLQSSVLQSSHQTAIEGFVRDASGAGVAGASVRLLRESIAVATVVSDAKGFYRFSAVEPGKVSLQAEKVGFLTSSSGAFDVASGEMKSVDLTLAPASSGKNGSAAPEFYDEPQFTVAGVADIANHGGHGSDTVSRTAQALAKDIALAPKLSSALPPMPSPDEQSWRAAVDRNPGSFEANQHLGLILEREGKAAEALPYLEHARSQKPEDDSTALALARAYADSGQLAKADQTALTLLATQDSAELRALLGDIEEKRGDSVQAVQNYQRAAELEPSEPNLFAWGAELLLHRALEPALQVFNKGIRLFPTSQRMMVGLGVAQYASGSPALAAQTLCRASDLEPSNPSPYLVLGEAQLLDPPGTSIVTEKMERFARLYPENALANYYYAVSLQKRKEPDSEKLDRIESLLETAIRRDPRFASAYLQLGAVYQARNQWPRAISEYQQAIALDPLLAEAHYRLAQAYRRIGEKAKAERELALFDQASKKNLEAVEKDSQQIPQFVYTLRRPESPSH